MRVVGLRWRDLSWSLMASVPVVCSGRQGRKKQEDEGELHRQSAEMREGGRRSSRPQRGEEVAELAREDEVERRMAALRTLAGAALQWVEVWALRKAWDVERHRP